MLILVSGYQLINTKVFHATYTSVCTFIALVANIAYYTYLIEGVPDCMKPSFQLFHFGTAFKLRFRIHPTLGGSVFDGHLSH